MGACPLGILAPATAAAAPDAVRWLTPG